MKNEALHFGTIRHYCSRIDRVSICLQDTLQYENFRNISQVPASYDYLYLFGFGIIESEFESENPRNQGTQLKKCIEFMLSKEPRETILKCGRKEKRNAAE